MEPVDGSFNLGDKMDLKKYLQDHSKKQMKYEPVEITNWQQTGWQYRQSAIKRITSYIVEEAVEVNRECTKDGSRYKPFKESKDIDVDLLREEIADVFIQWMALVSVSGTTPEEMEQVIQSKLKYNQTREDHQL